MSFEIRCFVDLMCLNPNFMQKMTFFSVDGTSTSTWVIGRTMDSESPYDSKGADNELAAYTFLERGLVIDFAVIDNIMDKGRNFVK